MKFAFLIAISLCFTLSLFPSAEEAQDFNESLGVLKEELEQKFEEAFLYFDKGEKEEKFRDLLSSVGEIRKKIRGLEEKWRKDASEEITKSDEPYAMWDVGETTLSQLIMEYGSNDFLYVIPQELSSMKIHLFSGIPLPHESWGEMIEMILSQNGVGIKKVSPFVKQLYIMKLDPSAVEAVVAKEEDLSLFDKHERLFFVLSPPPEQLKSVQAFLDRFCDPKQAIIQAIGSKVAIVASKETIERLMGLYHAIWEKNQGKVVRIAPLSKMSPKEVEKVLKAVFSEASQKGRPTYFTPNIDELTTLIIPQGLALIGEGPTVERAEKMIAEMEAQIESPDEKIVYWYTCKHTTPEDVVEVLAQVYGFLTDASSGKTQAESSPSPLEPSKKKSSRMREDSDCSLPELCPGPGYRPVLPASAPFIQPSAFEGEEKKRFGNFIIDPKTTSIFMVVKKEELPKIKAILKRLDVPKKMVQLDVLLVEKKFKDNREIGFSLLQLGTNSSGKKETALSYSTTREADRFTNGLFSFLFSRPSGKFPAADMKFNFLLAQEDVRIKANPSILAINQTPAQISIVEEISINNGAFPFNSPTGTVIQDSYTRAQYGITIHLTPTIHSTEEEKDEGSVFLETDIEFDSTTIISPDNRPPVTRRNIQNQVRINDGETVILGGLRQQIEENAREKIPFLGDLPGIGKLFGTSRSRDVSTEMFIFITPKIIRSPKEDLIEIRTREYQKRAGDIPEFLRCIDEAKENARKKLFRQSLKLLFEKY